MIKKILPILTVVAMLVVLAACGTNSSTTSTTTIEMTQETKLIVGTLKLDGTDQAVDAAEAATLIPLWDLVSTLKMSGTASDSEIQAVIQQIQDTMTPEQVSAIDAMNLTQEDAASAMSDLGFGAGGALGTPDATAMASGVYPGMDGGVLPDMGGIAPSGTIPSGGMPSGGMPSGDMSGGGPAGMGGSSGSGLSSSQVATFEAQQSTTGSAPQMDSTTMLIRALLAYLRSIK